MINWVERGLAGNLRLTEVDALYGLGCWHLQGSDVPCIPPALYCTFSVSQGDNTVSAEYTTLCQLYLELPRAKQGS